MKLYLGSVTMRDFDGLEATQSSQSFEHAEDSSRDIIAAQPDNLVEEQSDLESPAVRVSDTGQTASAGSVQGSDQLVSGPGEDGLADSATETESVETPIADAIEALIPEMRAYAKRLCRDDALADDLVQDTCMKAWAARESFKTGAEARPWLFRILRNEYYQITRRSWRSVEYDQEKAENTLVASTNLESASDLRVMKQLLGQLPQNQYEAMLLVVAGGFTYEEVGKICGCSAGTIKSRVSRGREAMHRLMQMSDAQLQEKSKTDASDTSNVMTSIVEEIQAIVSRSEGKAA